jgi:hypothetical protein
MTWVKYECGCIEGPMIVQNPKFKIQDLKCPLHKKQGIATLVDCLKGRPIRVWVSDTTCEGAELCPSRYRSCKYWG